MRVVICWTHTSGYMAAFWRTLVRRGDVDLMVLARKFPPGASWAITDDILAGVPSLLMDDAAFADADAITRAVLDHRPDIVVIAGWTHAPYLALTRHPELRNAHFFMTMDTNYKGNLRQKLGRLKLRSLVARLDGAIVGGERSYQMAKYLGFADGSILRGAFGFDDEAFSGVRERRMAQPGGWPKSFLFSGRYVAQKAIDTMLEGYRLYRAQTSDPWPLACCGAGELKHLLSGAPGVMDLGFVAPKDQPAVMAAHGVAVLVSRSEPWGVTLVESLAAGMPAICTQAYSSGVEVLRPYYNGLYVGTDDPNDLARAMRWMHDHYQELAEMGRRGELLADPFSAKSWARRWFETFAAAMQTAGYSKP